jgi:hypothetical protein
MQLSMLDGLDLYSLRRVLPSDADHVAHSRPVVNTRPLASSQASDLAFYDLPGGEPRPTWQGGVEGH